MVVGKGDDLKDVLKIGDVGITKKAIDITSTMCGTPLYAAPEVLSGRFKYGQKSDIFGLGLILWEMWYGELITVKEDYARLDQEAFMTRLVDGSLRPDPERDYPGPTAWQDLLTRCWNTDPKIRPASTECIDVITNNL